MPRSKPSRSHLLEYHRPHLDLKETPHKLKRASALCIRNLNAYRAPSSPFVYPRRRCAAVLVALFVGRMGDLYVLLNRRASTLRAYAGDTSLPGGKYEDGDSSLEETARREAFEEIGLPPDKTKVPLLCILEPFLAGNHLIVTPVVVLILDNTLQPVLNSSEVTLLFSHPLRGFLSSDAPSTDPSDMTTLELPYHTTQDNPWEGDPLRKTRMHRFLTGREEGGTKPIYGLTAAIMIRVASIGYAQEPLFELRAPSQPPMSERIAWVFAHDHAFRQAAEEEGIDVEGCLRKWRRMTKQKEKVMGRREEAKL